VNCSVLIVEDEAIVAENLKEILSNWGYQVLGIVPSGRTALQITKQIRPDVVIMDVKIDGDLNGIETALVIRTFFEDEIPIIFISGYSIEKYPLIKALGKYCYLNKPIESQDLLNAIKSLGVEASPRNVPDSLDQQFG
jgi:CheY-like chemotaxis protein